jgi:polyhydroxyalkanoate synthesis repressor PhaR
MFVIQSLTATSSEGSPCDAVRQSPLACYAALRYNPFVTTRQITRYGSRKLYDTQARRYVSLDELARHVRDGEHLRVTDKKTGQDVTTQTLALVVYEQARQGAAVTSEVLHDVIRSGIGQLQTRVDEIVHAGVDRMKPLLRAREEMDRLRAGMKEIERSLREFGGDAKQEKGRRAAKGAARKQAKKRN